MSGSKTAASAPLSPFAPRSPLASVEPTRSADDMTQSSSDWPVPTLRRGAFQNLDRVVSILRYHRMGQLVHRSLKLLRIPRKRPFRSTASRHIPATRETPELSRIAERKRYFAADGNPAESAQRFLDGRYCFLNQEISLHPFDARLPADSNVPQLWTFHFHYHEFLLDVAAAGAAANNASLLDAAWRFLASWIDAYPPPAAAGSADAWHPFCISRRLPVWFVLLSQVPRDETVRGRVIQSSFDQARYLACNLEHDLGGNHLLENLRALALASVVYEGADARRWLQTVERILPREIDRQILAHGEHFERSPMYHALMLDAMLDLRDALENDSPATSRLCADAAARMGCFLDSILHPDREIPLLGDSALNKAARPELLVDAARPIGAARTSRKLGAENVGPYWIWREESGNQLLFDAGPVAADDLPAHAHCDLLGIEASVAGRRFIVDTGVFDYEDGDARQYCRSTAAHNVLEIDGQNQCDVWSKFRMGYRGRPGRVAVNSIQDFESARSTHNGYRRIGVPVVERFVQCRQGGPWIVVDWADGRGEHSLVNRLHLHPSVVCKLESPTHAAIQCDGVRITVEALGEGELALENAWYCPEFGKRDRNHVIVWKKRGRLPLAAGWVIRFNESPRSDSRIRVLEKSIDLLTQHEGGVIQVSLSR